MMMISIPMVALEGDSHEESVLACRNTSDLFGGRSGLGPYEL